MLYEVITGLSGRLPDDGARLEALDDAGFAVARPDQGEDHRQGERRPAEQALGLGEVPRLVEDPAQQMGRRGLPIESPTARADVRIREAFVEIPSTAALVPGQRVFV